jgi:Mg-chelatase subunit ChlD
MAKKLLALGEVGRIVLKLPGGQVQPLPERERAYAFLLIDCSLSMAGSRLIQAKEGSLAFAREALKKGYSVGLIRFAGTAEVLCYPKDGLDALESKLQRLGVAGGTNMTDALDLAVRELAPLSGARVIVIATDGEPDSRSSSLQAAQRARTAGIDIIAIGTEDADKGFLALLATRFDLLVSVASNNLKTGISEAAKLLPRASCAKK